MKLTIDEAIAIQQTHLEEWSTILVADFYIHIVDLCQKDNARLKEIVAHGEYKDYELGFDVIRGNRLDALIHNERIKRKPLAKTF